VPFKLDVLKTTRDVTTAYINSNWLSTEQSKYKIQLTNKLIIVTFRLHRTFHSTAVGTSAVSHPSRHVPCNDNSNTITHSDSRHNSTAALPVSLSYLQFSYFIKLIKMCSMYHSMNQDNGNQPLYTSYFSFVIIVFTATVTTDKLSECISKTSAVVDELSNVLH